MYLILKHIHLTCVGVSFSLFLLRFTLLVVRKKPLPKWLKVLPHSIDTILLASAIAMAWLVGFNLSNSPWLLAKVIALLFYIGFGELAMRGHGKIKALGFVLACSCFAYIVGVALLKNPWLFW